MTNNIEIEILTDREAALIAHIKSENEKTRKWVAEDPENRFAGLLLDEISHWRELGIDSVAELERYELATQAYDLHKEAYGFRARWDDIYNQKLEDLKVLVDELSAKVHAQVEREEAEQSLNAEEFEKRIESIIESGAGDRATALRWIVDAQRDVDDYATGDYIRWSLNLPYKYESEFNSVLAS